MNPIGIIPDRLLLGRWDEKYYIIYPDTMSNGATMLIPWGFIRRTLLITDL
jgi:hypothetical protein